MRFPTVKGENLNQRSMTLPDDLRGALNLVIIAFKQYQQIAVNTWVPILQELEQQHPSFAFYELPTLAPGWSLVRGMIDGGMRAGIPDAATRERTITLYIPKESYREALAIPDEETIHLLLLDDKGEVLWRTQGEFEPDKGEELKAFIESQAKD